MMTFKQYLKKHKIKQETAAKALDKTQSFISRLSSGEADPDFSTAMDIEVYTGRAVPVEAWPSFARLKDRIKPSFVNEGATQ